MSRRSSGRSIIGLILEIGFIALVVSILPKLNFQPQQPADLPSRASSDSPWWQAEPAAVPTSWQADEPQPVHVQQTLENASRRLLQGAADFAGKTASEIAPPPTVAKPIDAQPRKWTY
jgi:hypothetical protein